MTNSTGQDIPIKTLHLFPVLDKLLINLLQSLTPEEWHAKTIAPLWCVKDIAAHLLDGNLKALSISRDQYFGETAPTINSYQDLVDFLNGLNATWVAAAKRLSPQLITQLLESTGESYHRQLQSLDPFAEAVFPVAWAGQERSSNWFHIAREYTEKFIHQQQIREATGKQALYTKELYHPFIDTFMYGLPFTYKDITAENNTTICITVTGEEGGNWHLVKRETGWQLAKERVDTSDATVILDPGTAWKLFSKGISPAVAMNTVKISGNGALGAVALQMISVMA